MIEDNAELTGFRVEEFIVRSAQPEHISHSFLTARQHLADLEADSNLLERAKKSIDAVTAFVDIRQTDNDDASLVDFFSLDQILEMEKVLHAYLGSEVDTFLSKPTAPTGYSTYIERLSGHFSLSDDDVTSNFGAFERRHSNPVENAKGPFESNSRNYAMEANERILRQFKTYYQLSIDPVLKGPTKQNIAGETVWERGVAECQFLVLDYMRDIFANNVEQKADYPPRANSMTTEDIGANIANIISNKGAILRRVTQINPILAAQVEQAIGNLLPHTRSVMYRGRMGAPSYLRNPAKAEADINAVANLLDIAGRLEQLSQDQAEIPILEL